MLQKLLSNRVSIGGTGVGGALAVVTVWIIESASGQPVPADVAVALGVIFGAIVGHVAGYQQAEKERPPN